MGEGLHNNQSTRKRKAPVTLEMRETGGSWIAGDKIKPKREAKAKVKASSRDSRQPLRRQKAAVPQRRSAFNAATGQAGQWALHAFQNAVPATVGASAVASHACPCGRQSVTTVTVGPVAVGVCGRCADLSAAAKTLYSAFFGG